MTQHRPPGKGNDTTIHPGHGLRDNGDDRLPEASQQAVQTVMGNARSWEDVHQVIDALRKQAVARFGRDYADPSFDV